LAAPASAAQDARAAAALSTSPPVAAPPTGLNIRFVSRIEPTTEPSYTTYPAPAEVETVGEGGQGALAGQLELERPSRSRDVGLARATARIGIGAVFVAPDPPVVARLLHLVRAAAAAAAMAAMRPPEPKGGRPPLQRAAAGVLLRQRDTAGPEPKKMQRVDGQPALPEVLLPGAGCPPRLSVHVATGSFRLLLAYHGAPASELAIASVAVDLSNFARPGRWLNQRRTECRGWLNGVSWSDRSGRVRPALTTLMGATGRDLSPPSLSALVAAPDRGFTMEWCFTGAGAAPAAILPPATLAAAAAATPEPAAEEVLATPAATAAAGPELLMRLQNLRFYFVQRFVLESLYHLRDRLVPAMAVASAAAPDALAGSPVPRLVVAAGHQWLQGLPKAVAWTPALANAATAAGRVLRTPSLRTEVLVCDGEFHLLEDSTAVDALVAALPRLTMRRGGGAGCCCGAPAGGTKMTVATAPTPEASAFLRTALFPHELTAEDAELLAFYDPADAPAEAVTLLRRERAAVVAERAAVEAEGRRVAERLKTETRILRALERAEQMVDSGGGVGIGQDADRDDLMRNVVSQVNLVGSLQLDRQEIEASLASRFALLRALDDEIADLLLQEAAAAA
ncbi:unnamed protein product, partial [Phaeothamnion confervicola]